MFSEDEWWAWGEKNWKIEKLTVKSLGRTQKQNGKQMWCLRVRG